MNNINQFFKKILSGIAIAGGLVLVLPAAAQTPPDLSVTFNPDPLFKQVDFAPGQTTGGTVTVVNHTGDLQKITVEAVNKVDDGNFSDQLELEIRLGGSVLYSKTLKDFFGDGQVYLTDVAAGKQVQYDFGVTFKNSAGDHYQNQSAGFDLLVGFLGTDGNIVPLSAPGSSSGGGGGLPPGLTIFENQILVGGIAQTSATVAWTTSYGSTSQVVYGPNTGSDPFVLAPPAYGYPFYTVEDPAYVTRHIVVLNGLAPGTEYRFRVVSHASPPTVSYSHVFATLSDNMEPSNEPAQPGQAAGAQSVAANDENIDGAAFAKNNLLAVNKPENGEVLGAATTTPLQAKTIVPAKNIYQSHRSRLWIYAVAALVLLIIMYFLRRKKFWMKTGKNAD